LDLSKVSDVIELGSEVACPVLGWVVTEDSAEDYESELIGIGR